VIEITAGLAVAVKPRHAAYIAAAWLAWMASGARTVTREAGTLVTESSRAGEVPARRWNP